MSEAKKEVPKFKVMQAPGFFDGHEMHAVGTEIEWSPPGPDDWDAEKNGPHHMSSGPSMSFEPLNDAAIALHKEHRERIKKANSPVSTEMQKMQEMLTKQSAQIDTLMNALLEERAEKRRADEKKK
jgi:hypothetical protein